MEWSGFELWPGVIVLCSKARHFTLTVLLFTQVYKWVPANMLGVTPRWTSSNTPSRFMLKKPEFSAGPMGHLGLYKGFAFTFYSLKEEEKNNIKLLVPF